VCAIVLAGRLSGIDCSGLVKTLFSKFNIDLPRSSKEQFNRAKRVNRDELEIGDLVFFSSGDSTDPWASTSVTTNFCMLPVSKQVIVSDLSKLWYTVPHLGARRVVDLWDEPVTE
jgi:hypothetical protein